jgi:hypothetical protein
MRVGRQVERWQSADGKHLLRIFTRGPDCFYFVELSEMTEKDETFWDTTRTSEDYPSLEATRSTALAKLPWMKEVI